MDRPSCPDKPGWSASRGEARLLLRRLQHDLFNVRRGPLARYQQSGLVRELPLGLKEWGGNDHPVKGPTTSPSIQKLW